MPALDHTWPCNHRWGSYRCAYYVETNGDMCDKCREQGADTDYVLLPRRLDICHAFKDAWMDCLAGSLDSHRVGVAMRYHHRLIETVLELLEWKDPDIYERNKTGIMEAVAKWKLEQPKGSKNKGPW